MKTCYVCGKEDNDLIDMGIHEVCKTCVSCGNDEDWVSVDLDLGNDVLALLATMSMEDQITVNMLIVKIFKDFLKMNEGKTTKEVQQIFNNEGIKVDGPAKKKRSTKKRKKE